MDPMMLVAMVVAAAVTRAWERSKRRAALGWQAAREGRERRDATRRARRADWAQRVDTARQTGPRNPLWWPYAVGFVAAATARAVVAAGQGAREGAPMGAAEGRRFGRAAAERGWEWRRTWREYRQRTSRGDAPGDVVMEACPACGVYTAITSLVPDPELEKVCEPCAQWRAGGEPPPDHERPDDAPPVAHDSETRQAGGVTPRRLNGELHFGADDDDPNGMRQCTRCDGTGVDPVGDETCRDCRARQEQRNADHETRNDWYAPMDRAPVVQVLGARWSPNLAADDTSRYRILHDNQPGGTMTAALTTGTGEGYTDTVTTLQTLTRQLAAAHETALRLSDQLTADELDADTLTYLTDMMDALDAAVPVTELAARHVERRHEPVAEAVASAGGSGNVARKGWYDDL